MAAGITGFVPPDDRWQKMRDVFAACAAAGLDTPAEVVRFFAGQQPDPAGQEVDVPHRGWQDEFRQGLEIRVDDIPANVKVIRFYNSV
jgi:hypothetical protein